MSAKEVDEQTLNVQNKNSSYFIGASCANPDRVGRTAAGGAAAAASAASLCLSAQEIPGCLLHHFLVVYYGFVLVLEACSPVTTGAGPFTFQHQAPPENFKRLRRPPRPQT